MSVTWVTSDVREAPRATIVAKSLLRSEPLNERYGLFATFEWQAPDFYG